MGDHRDQRPVVIPVRYAYDKHGAGFGCHAEVKKPHLTSGWVHLLPDRESRPKRWQLRRFLRRSEDRSPGASRGPGGELQARTPASRPPVEPRISGGGGRFAHSSPSVYPRRSPLRISRYVSMGAGVDFGRADEITLPRRSVGRHVPGSHHFQTQGRYSEDCASMLENRPLALPRILRRYRGP